VRAGRAGRGPRSASPGRRGLKFRVRWRHVSTRGEVLEAAGLTDVQRATLLAFCDTIVPSIEREHDPDGFWARKASDLAVEQGAEMVLSTLPAELQAGLGLLLDALAQQGFAGLSQP